MLEQITNLYPSSWDNMFLLTAILWSQKSKDPNTKCAAVITDDLNRIVSIGYNSPVRNVDDFKLNLERPFNRFHCIHAEHNAYLNAARSGNKIYVTGKPCVYCLQLMYHVDIRDIVYTDFSKPKMVEDELMLQAYENFYSALQKPLKMTFIPFSSLNINIITDIL